jgi:hypothetical protein
VQDEVGKLKEVVTDGKNFNSGAAKKCINMRFSPAAKFDKEN